jgi:aminomuconate-semialdehyde/2-hydroxymuconate-6-semialdehyde dehydrogenase
MSEQDTVKRHFRTGLSQLELIADSIEENKDLLAKKQVDAAKVPLKFAYGDLAYAIYTLKNFGRQIMVLLEQGVDLSTRTGIGKIAVSLPYNMPAACGAISMASAMVFPENSIEIKLPSKSGPFGEALQQCLAAEDESLLHNSDGTPIFSSARGQDFIPSRLQDQETRLVHVFGHPNIITPDVRRYVVEHDKTFLLEGPGSNPAIVHETADLRAAAKTVASLRTINSGQVCMGVEVIYVHRSVGKQFLDLLMGELDKKVIGDPYDPKTDVGPVAVSIADAVSRMLVASLEAGAKISYVHPFADSLRTNGKLELVSQWEGYKFLPPTIVTGADPQSPLVRMEKFSPVLPVMMFDDAGTVLSQLDSRDYGLAATFYGDEKRHKDLIQILRPRYGNLFVNVDIFDMTDGFDVLKQKWGGEKNSRIKLTKDQNSGDLREAHGASYFVEEFSRPRDAK